MARSPRDRLDREREFVTAMDDDAVRAALLGFADALDPAVVHDSVPRVKHGRVAGRESFSNGSAHNYLAKLRKCHHRGLDLLGADVDTVNAFMEDCVNPPGERRHGIVTDFENHLARSTAAAYQAGLRQFYRWATEPGGDGRPDVAVPFEAVDGSRRLRMFTPETSPSDRSERPGQAELDAMREACLRSQNTRRDRAFLELAAGTGQRVYALVTLRVGDVHLDGTDDVPFPHVYLNEAIHNDGDKGAIDRAGGRLRPFVADAGPVRAWLEHHPMRDPDVRAAHGAPERFDECYLFVGDLKQSTTDGGDHWSRNGARGMLARRKTDTASMAGVDTVETKVNPHVWRGYAYTRSKELPIDESVRRKVFGWAPGSDEGDRIYDHTALADAAEQFSGAWAEAFGNESDATAVAEQIAGPMVGGDLPPEARKALARELLGDEAFMAELRSGLEASSR